MWTVGPIGRGVRRARRPHRRRARGAGGRGRRRGRRSAASVKVRLTRAQVSAFIGHAAGVVAAGRPPCRFCGLPARPRRPRLPPDELTRWTAAGIDRRAAPRRGRGAGPHAVELERHVPRRGPLRRGRRPAPSTSRGRGERPLWDFPTGLDQREVAAYELSAALGWDLVPLTLLRDGPARPGLAAAVRRGRLRAALLHPLRGRGATTRPATDVRLRHRGQQHRPQERPLPRWVSTATSGASTTA